jgi:peptidoglycan/LPS O-acetylase OafA/YrhL
LALTALNGAEFVAFKFSGLKYQYGVPDVRLATLPLGLAAMMLAYSAKSWSMSGSIWHSALRNLAAISLPIYLMHLACALIIAKIFGVSGVILFVFTVIMTLCLSALANKSPARRLVQVR